MHPVSSSSSSAERMEAVFFRLHAGIVQALHKWTSPTCRSLTELLTLINAVAVFCILLWFHLHYVTRAQESCVTRLLQEELRAVGPQAPLVKIQIGGIWNQLGLEDGSLEINLFKQEMLHQKQLDLLDVWLQDPTFLFSTERAFLSLDAKKREEFGIREVFINLKTETCFTTTSASAERWGGELELYLLTNFIGWETVLVNALAACEYDHGSLFSFHSREILAIQQVANGGGGAPPAWYKLTAICTTLFLFGITTTLVHHTLRETQERMLSFTFDLQVLVANNASYKQLVFNHLMGSLAFVPIMVGMLFFLFEFYNDQLLAFMVMSIVWVCELYSVVCLRTRENVGYFPKLFFLYFCSFHLYFFLFPTGFYYTALTCCVVFLQFAMWSFFIRYEMPAYLSGRISSEHKRDMIQASAASVAAVLLHRDGGSNTVDNEPPPAATSVMESVAISSPPRLNEGSSSNNMAAAPATTPITANLEATTPQHQQQVIIPGGRKKRSTIHNPPPVEMLGLQPTVTTQSPEITEQFARQRRSTASSSVAEMPPSNLHVATTQAWEETRSQSQASGSDDWQIGCE